MLITCLGTLFGVSFSYIFNFTLKQVIIVIVIFLFLAIIFTVFSYFSMMKIIPKMAKGVEIAEDIDPELIHIVEDMAMIAKIPIPKVFLIEDESPNAFASGRNPENAMIGVTTGLRNILNREELEGVIAHEISHIKNYDIQITSLSVALTSFLVGAGAAIVTISWQILRSSSFSSRKKDSLTGGIIILSIIFLLLGWVIKFIGIPIAKIIQFALSREREFLADASGAQLTQNPQGLINALQKIDRSDIISTTQNSAISALYISKPKLTKTNSFFANLYQTHPETSDRITRLNNLM